MSESNKVKKPFYKKWWFIAIVVLIVASAIFGGGDDTDAPPEDTAAVENNDVSETPEDVVVEEPEETIVEEPEEDPAVKYNNSIQESLDNPIIIEGKGKTATDTFLLNHPINVAKITHTGSSNIQIKIFDSNDKSDLLVNEIGNYEGLLPILGAGDYLFDINADGNWKIEITPVRRDEQTSFSGKGDFVSTIFPAPKTGAWQFSHDGKSNFVIKLHTDNGTDLIVNEIGTIEGSNIVEFGGAAIGMWEIKADGNWSIQPK